MHHKHAVQSAILGLVMGAVLLFSSCATYKANPPKDFAAYPIKKNEFKAVHANGVVYRIQQIENKEKMPIDFWKEAMHSHLIESGYMFRDSSSLQIDNMPARSLEYAIPVGVQDYGYLAVIAMKQENIFLIESTGLLADFTENKANIFAALQTIEVK
jgi:hypothetical protein